MKNNKNKKYNNKNSVIQYFCLTEYYCINCRNKFKCSGFYEMNKYTNKNKCKICSNEHRRCDNDSCKNCCKNNCHNYNCPSCKQKHHRCTDDSCINCCERSKGGRLN